MPRDILLDSSLDVRVENGDFVTGESSEQHQHILLLAEKASFKENPGVGVGAPGYLEAEDPGGLMREIRLQFSQDGMKVNKISLDNGKLAIDANY